MLHIFQKHCFVARAPFVKSALWEALWTQCYNMLPLRLEHLATHSKVHMKPLFSLPLSLLGGFRTRPAMQPANPAPAACAWCLFLLLLLLPPVSPQCRAASNVECRKSSEFIPGLDLASRGFDITSLELSAFPVFNLNEWQNPDGSCNLCENPLVAGKPRQRLPLAVTNWKADPACQQEVQHSVAPSCVSVADAMSELVVRNGWKKDLDVELDPSTYTQRALAGTDSKWTSFCKRKTLEDKHIFLLHHASCSYYK